MKNKETGEFELLVGNGQIISGFFILALLLAVFFAMGFIVARAKYQQEPAPTAVGSNASDTRSPETRSSAAAPAPAASTEQSKPGEDQPPAQTAAQPETAPPVVTKSVPETKPEKAAASAPAGGGDDAVPGTYWQVSATTNIDAARYLQQTIKDMGLPVSLTQGPNKLTRVLVGPYKDTATMAKVKTQLENAGLQAVKHTQ